MFKPATPEVLRIWMNTTFLSGATGSRNTVSDILVCTFKSRLVIAVCAAVQLASTPINAQHTTQRLRLRNLSIIVFLYFFAFSFSLPTTDFLPVGTVLSLSFVASEAA